MSSARALVCPQSRSNPYLPTAERSARIELRRLLPAGPRVRARGTEHWRLQHSEARRTSERHHQPHYRISNVHLFWCTTSVGILGNTEVRVFTAHSMSSRTFLLGLPDDLLQKRMDSVNYIEEVLASLVN